jgi:hypothetical protein
MTERVGRRGGVSVPDDGEQAERRPPRITADIKVLDPNLDNLSIWLKDIKKIKKRSKKCVYAILL